MQNESTGFLESLRSVERVAGDLNFGSRAYGRGPANEVAVTREDFSSLSGLS
jgi:hypothetical protein